MFVILYLFNYLELSGSNPWFVSIATLVYNTESTNSNTLLGFANTVK